MSPYSLINTGTLRERAGVTSHSHFVPFPEGLRAFLRKLFERRISPAIIGEKSGVAAGVAGQVSEVALAATVVINLHPLDLASVREASRAVGMDEASFCALAVHRASRSVIDNEPFVRIV